MNAKELQERVHNNRNPKEYIQIYNNYGEREMLKQIRYEKNHLGKFEKIPTVSKSIPDGMLLNFNSLGESSLSEPYTDIDFPDNLSNFQSDFESSLDEQSAPRIIDTIDESDEEDNVQNSVKNYSKSPKTK